MEMADSHARDLAEYEERWRAGDFPALVEAIQFCHTAEAVVPLWLAQAISVELHAAFHDFRPRERGMKRSHKARLERARIQSERALWAEVFLAERGPRGSGRLIDGKPMTRAQAFEMASVQLQSTAARGSATEIEKAYNAERARQRRRLRETQETT